MPLGASSNLSEQENSTHASLDLDLDGNATGRRMGLPARLDTTFVVKESRNVVSKRKSDHGDGRMTDESGPKPQHHLPGHRRHERTSQP